MTKLNVILSGSDGILGVRPPLFLKKIETDIGRTAHELFAAFGGTSTQPIIAGALDEGILAPELVTLYMDYGDRICKGCSWKDKMKNLNMPLPKYDISELRSSRNVPCSRMLTNPDVARLDHTYWGWNFGVVAGKDLVAETVL